MNFNLLQQGFKRTMSSAPHWNIMRFNADELNANILPHIPVAIREFLNNLLIKYDNLQAHKSRE